MPLSEENLATLQANQAAIDAADEALTVADVADLPAAQATLDAAIATQDAFLNTLAADPPQKILPLVVTDVPALTLTIGELMTPLQLEATGGSGEYQWAAVNNPTIGMPDGLDITGAGVVFGDPKANPAMDTSDQNTVQFVVYDSDGRSAESNEAVWTLVDMEAIRAARIWSRTHLPMKIPNESEK